MSVKPEIALVIVDTQEDFVNGSLGSDAAKAIVTNVVGAIDSVTAKNPNAQVITTQDTHSDETYLETREGKYLPVKHCIINTKGWEIVPEIKGRLKSLKYRTITKEDFGSQEWQEFEPILHCVKTIVLVGLCTDICVVTNALILRTAYPDARIITLSDCCAGTSQEAHEAALLTMKSCQIEVMTLEEFNKGGYENNILLPNNEDKED